MNEVRDEYHTMEEIYRHRNLLFINLCLMVPEQCVWKLDEEKDWFILYLTHEDGQISYHIPRYYLPLVDRRIKQDQDFKWDGHNSQDVLNFLAKPLITEE